jgi:RHS repeat-associated protein
LAQETEGRHGRRSWTVFANGSTQLNAYSGTGAVGRLMFSNHSSKGGTRYVYLGGKLIAEHNNLTGVSFSHTDALGSVVAHTDAVAQLAGTRTRYEPYGATAQGDVPQSVGFTGHVNDPDTGLVYMQQRYYEPLVGGFLSVDPVVTNADDGTFFNRYDYAHGNPYRFKDPDGRSPETPSFLTLTTFASAERGSTLASATTAGALTRGLTLPAIAIAASPSAVALTASAVPAVPAAAAAAAGAIKSAATSTTTKIATATVLGALSKGIGPTASHLPPVSVQGARQIVQTIAEKSAGAMPKSTAAGAAPPPPRAP